MSSDTADSAPAFDFSAAYTVAGRPGVAWRAVRYATEWTEESWTLDCPEDDNVDHEHGNGCYLYNEPEQVARDDLVIAVMVGDDREETVDVSDLAVIDREGYCGGCGQVGCGWC